MLNIKEIEKNINVKKHLWKGNCFSISSKIVKHNIIKGKAVFGKYYGYISSNSMFSGKTHCQHGWIRTDDGRIIDPTRWVFENVEPYIFETTIDNKDYDEGANLLRELIHRPAPEFNSSIRSIKIEDNEINLIFNVLLGNKKEPELVSLDQIIWCASLSINHLGEFAYTLFNWLEKEKLGFLAPIDNFNMVLNK